MRLKCNGFTLVEMIAVVLILAAIAMIALPTVTRNIKDSKEKAYNEQIIMLKKATNDYVIKNIGLFSEDGVYTINLATLKSAGLVDLDIRNPKTSLYLSDDMRIEITLSGNQYSYIVGMCDDTEDCLIDDEANNVDISYDSIPSIILNGSAIEYLEVDINCLQTSSCSVIYGPAQTSDGNYTSNPKVFEYTCLLENCNWEEKSNVDISKLGTYRVKYNYTSSTTGKSAVPVVKEVTIRDTTKPDINFPATTTLSVDNNQFVGGFDLLDDVTITDNSEHEYESSRLKVTSNLSTMPGTYDIIYEYEDSSGNVRTKTRNITVVEQQ